MSGALVVSCPVRLSEKDVGWVLVMRGALVVSWSLVVRYCPVRLGEKDRPVRLGEKDVGW
jgi:hypothetical protein